MKKFKAGFTLVEVSIFLAISGLLFFGISLGVQNSIRQQRYNDSVQSFAEFLTTAYAGVMNVQGKSSNGGRSEEAIYGKLITFGESKKLDGSENNNDEVFMYTVIGGANPTGSTAALDLLKGSGANVLEKNTNGNYDYAGIVESYIPKWEARIEPTGNNTELKAALLIIRHPTSGSVFTYYKENGTIEVNERLKHSGSNLDNLLISELGNFTMDKNADLCVNPDPDAVGTIRSDVRVLVGASNSSGVSVMPRDEGNLCNE